MKNVLVVDNDQEFHRHFCEGTRRSGFHVTECADGFEGIASLTVCLPDIGITDIVMEGMEGIEFLLKIRERVVDLPVIVISGNERYLDNAQKIGASDTLLKPFRIPEILSCIENANAV